MFSVWLEPNDNKQPAQTVIAYVFIRQRKQNNHLQAVTDPLYYRLYRTIGYNYRKYLFVYLRSEVLLV